MFKKAETLTPFRALDKDIILMPYLCNQLPFEAPINDANFYQHLFDLRLLINENFGIEPVIARAYLNETEKHTFSLCIYNSVMDDQHRLYEHLKIETQISVEYQENRAVNIFTFDKAQTHNLFTHLRELFLEGSHTI